MSDHDDVEPAPPFEPNVRVFLNMEPGAYRMLEELAARIYPDKPAGKRRALVVEMVVRRLYRQLLEEHR